MRLLRHNFNFVYIYLSLFHTFFLLIFLFFWFFHFLVLFFWKRKKHRPWCFCVAILPRTKVHGYDYGHSFSCLFFLFYFIYSHKFLFYFLDKGDLWFLRYLFRIQHFIFFFFFLSLYFFLLQIVHALVLNHFLFVSLARAAFFHNFLYGFNVCCSSEIFADTKEM